MVDASAIAAAARREMEAARGYERALVEERKWEYREALGSKLFAADIPCMIAMLFCIAAV